MNEFTGRPELTPPNVSVLRFGLRRPAGDEVCHSFRKCLAPHGGHGSEAVLDHLPQRTLGQQLRGVDVLSDGLSPLQSQRIAQ